MKKVNEKKKIHLAKQLIMNFYHQLKVNDKEEHFFIFFAVCNKKRTKPNEEIIHRAFFCTLLIDERPTHGDSRWCCRIELI